MWFQIVGNMLWLKLVSMILFKMLFKTSHYKFREFPINYTKSTQKVVKSSKLKFL